MVDLTHLNALPYAALLLANDSIVAVNTMAQHYLPQLQQNMPLPQYMPLTRAGTGAFTAGASTYSFRCTPVQDGVLLVFYPAPQTALSNAQLEGAMRQLRQFMQEGLGYLASPSGAPVSALHQSFYRMFRLMDNLERMRLASCEGDSLPHTTTLDLAGLCKELVTQTSPLLADSQISLSLHTPLPSLLIPGDPKLLQRVILELISNSAKAAGKGGHIRLTLHAKSGFATLSCWDSGGDIAQRQLYAMLQQDGDQYLPTPEMGAGLGLSVVRHIVALHKGTLLVDCGQGAPTVVLSLPRGPLDTRVQVQTPLLQRDGGLPELLVALADVLAPRLFEQAGLE